jgi:hypothetical protein
MGMMTRFSFVGWAAVGVAIAASGCLFSPDDKKDTPPPQVTFEAPTTPAAVLRNFEKAYSEQNIVEYRKTIADVFQFRPNQDEFEDVLNKDEDEDSVERMFDEALSVQIRLDNAGPADSEYLDEYPPDEGFRQIVVPAARLEVATTRDEGQGPITYLVDGDRALFMLKETSPGVWQIVMQEDQS